MVEVYAPNYKLFMVMSGMTNKYTDYIYDIYDSIDNLNIDKLKSYVIKYNILICHNPKFIDLLMGITSHFKEIKIKHKLLYYDSIVRRKIIINYKKEYKSLKLISKNHKQIPLDIIDMIHDFII